MKMIMQHAHAHICYAFLGTLGQLFSDNGMGLIGSTLVIHLVMFVNGIPNYLHVFLIRNKYEYSYLYMYVFLIPIIPNYIYMYS